MKLFTWVFFLILMINCKKGLSQNIDSSTLNKLVNKEPLPYVQDNGKLMGCGYTMECAPMHVIFYKVYFNKQEKRITLHGRVMDPNGWKDKDTVGVYSFIALARPNGERLDSIRTLHPSYIRDPKDKHKNRFPYRTGDFIIDVKFGQDERLYFNSLAFEPIEFNIGQLLKSP